MFIDYFIGYEKFHHYFQPIYSVVSKKKLGYEALLRSEHFLNPETAFLEAKKRNRLYELDSRSMHKAVSAYHSAGLLSKEGNLFVNVFPSTILHSSFPSFLNKIMTDFALNSQQIILEITETECVNRFHLLKSKIFELKSQGFQIALDDVGKGYFNFQSIIELEPNYLKLDRYLSNDLHLSRKKQALILVFLDYCKENNVQLILEGLEKEIEVKTAESLGVPIAQGYFLGKPTSLMNTV